ncbi:MAG: hypothetical protein ACODAU_03800, partial [Myxococcota bacterium]
MSEPMLPPKKNGRNLPPPPPEPRSRLVPILIAVLLASGALLAVSFGGADGEGAHDSRDPSEPAEARDDTQAKASAEDKAEDKAEEKAEDEAE